MKPITRLRRAGVPVLLAAVCAACAVNDNDVVTGFVDAYNRHDVDAMLEMTIGDMRWMSVAGDKVVVEASGKDELRAAMTDYFTSIPSTRSALLAVQRSGNFVTTVEQASWSADGMEKSQCSTAVYRLDDEKIADVWYFAAYECPVR